MPHGLNTQYINIHIYIIQNVFLWNLFEYFLLEYEKLTKNSDIVFSYSRKGQSYGPVDENGDTETKL